MHVVQKEQGKSFKALKKQAKTKGNGLGPDPVHESYQFCIKKQAVDIDSIGYSDLKGVKSVVVVAQESKATAVLCANGKILHQIELAQSNKVTSIAIASGKAPKDEALANFDVVIAVFESS